MKCRYPQCRHESRELASDEAVQIGKSYYHADCAAEKRCKEEIVKFWTENIDPEPIYTNLKRTINQIVEKGVPADKLLWLVKWSVTARFKLRYPGGLYYLIKDEEAEAAWKKLNAKTYSDADFVVTVDKASKPEFVYKAQKSGFTRIIK